MADKLPIVGGTCNLLEPTRLANGQYRFPQEGATILKVMENLGRQMVMIKFEDGTTTFVFPSEIELH